MGHENQIVPATSAYLNKLLKDAPEDVKRQMEQEAGFTPSQTISPAGSEQIIKHQQANKPEPTKGANGQR